MKVLRLLDIEVGALGRRRTRVPWRRKVLALALAKAAKKRNGLAEIGPALLITSHCPARLRYPIWHKRVSGTQRNKYATPVEFWGWSSCPAHRTALSSVMHQLTPV